MRTDPLFCILVYDSPDDRRRRRLAKVLESVGERVQWSVFEALLHRDQLADVRARCHRELQPEDHFRIYVLCRRCRDGAEVQGRPANTTLAAVWIC